MEKLLLKPDETGYQLTENQNSLGVVELNGGADFTRLDVIDGSRFVTLQWSGQPKRFKTVRDFFNLNLALNCPQFLIDLLIGDDIYTEYICNLIPDSVKTLQPAGINWIISATFEVQSLETEVVTFPT